MVKRTLLFFLLSSAAVLCAGARTGHIIVCDGHRVMMRGDRMSIEEMTEKRNELGKRFFYFERNGKRYVVRDTAVIARVFALYEPSRAAKTAEKEAIKKQRELARHERALEMEIERIEQSLDDDASNQAELELRQIELENAAKKLELEAERLEQVERRYEQERERLEKHAEGRMQRLIAELLRNGSATRLDH